LKKRCPKAEEKSRWGGRGKWGQDGGEKEKGKWVAGGLKRNNKPHRAPTPSVVT